MASVPFSSGAGLLLAAIEANFTYPTATSQSPSVSLEEASSTTRSFLVTFPPDVGDVAAMVGYGDGGVLSVAVEEKTQGSVQVIIRHRPGCPQPKSVAMLVTIKYIYAKLGICMGEIRLFFSRKQYIEGY